MRLNLPIIRTPAEVIELLAPLSELNNHFRQGHFLKICAGMDTTLCEALRTLGPDAPDLTHRECGHEFLNLLRQNGELTVGFAPVAGDLGEHLVRGNACRSRQAGLLQDLRPDFLGDIPGVTPPSRGSGHIQVGLIEGERLHQWGVVIKDLTDLLRRGAVEIESKWKEDQVRTALPCHEPRHG